MNEHSTLHERADSRVFKQGRWPILGLSIGLLVLITACIVPTIHLPANANPTIPSGILPFTRPTATMVQLIPVEPRKLTVVTNLNTMGDPGAKVKLDVWEDFQCPACKHYSENIEPLVVNDYVVTGKVFYTFHFYPFLDGGQGESHQAAYAAMCAAAQGQFWYYHDTLFANWLGENAGSFTDARLTGMAVAIGLNMDDFNQCYKAGTYAAQVQQDYADGTTRGVQGTPTVMVNGTILTPGYVPSYDQIAQAIDAALAGK
ncbi:MAG TPA: thioredoxin domain-containing protein [Anaerolineales bacterium]|nr:thioredoxin domain-containing protein [Anaerolineales bacterium]